MSARWIETCGNVSQLEELLKTPKLKGHREPRVAFVGRSNVGKSTLMNALMKVKLAQTSAEPGKTRLIHFYLAPKLGRILVDLPGYGFAKVSMTDRDRWAKFINAYLRVDQGLERALILIDSRNGPSDLDRQAIEFLKFEGIPLSVVCTKTDKLKTQSERSRRKKEIHAALKEMGIQPEELFWVSGIDLNTLKPLYQELSKKVVYPDEAEVKDEVESELQDDDEVEDSRPSENAGKKQEEE